ncbi:hypothetical protein P7K49_005285, partial [Saguinus oedipus]
NCSPCLNPSPPHGTTSGSKRNLFSKEATLRNGRSSSPGDTCESWGRDLRPVFKPIAVVQA